MNETWDAHRVKTGQNRWVVALAGGHGMRLQAFVRTVLGTDRPKQFCAIIGRRSMLRHTWDRALCLVPAARLVTVITAGQESFLADEEAAGIPGALLVQPRNRDTGPGLLLPLLWIAEQDPGASVVVFPADHFIWEEGRFLEVVQTAGAAAESYPGQVVLLGIEARTPETGYGWITPGAAPDGRLAAAGLFRVQGFWEKPDRATAGRLQAAGSLWNSFVLVGRVAALLALAEAHLPRTLASLRAACAGWNTPRGTGALDAAYRRLKSSNFSRDVLEPGSASLLVQVARGIHWCDWGDPERILQTVHQFHRTPSWLSALEAA